MLLGEDDVLSPQYFLFVAHIVAMARCPLALLSVHKRCVPPWARKDTDPLSDSAETQILD